jgi:hypothetical protein
MTSAASRSGRQRSHEPPAKPATLVCGSSSAGRLPSEQISR